jgi:hypothetical protein
LKIFLLFVTNLSAQDTEMVTYVNLYRKHFKKSELKLSDKLTEIAIEQNKIIMSNDSLSHSHKASEIATMGKNLPFTYESKQQFISFLKVLGIKYIEPKTNEEAKKYIKLYCLFLFDKSRKHKSILLGDYNKFGLDIVINSVSYKSTEMVVNGKIIKFDKIKNHYTAKFYCVVDFK